MIAFIILHWVWALCSSGVLAALGVGGSIVGWPVVLKHWKAILVALLVIATMIVVVLLYADLERTKAVEVQDKANYAIVVAQDKTLNAVNQNLVAQLNAQSQSIKDAAGYAFAAQAASKAALLDARAKQTNDAKTIAMLRARAANPTTNQGSCDDEISILRSGL